MSGFIERKESGLRSKLCELTLQNGATFQADLQKAFDPKQCDEVYGLHVKVQAVLSGT